MTATLLTDVQIHQEQTQDHCGAVHTPVHPGVQGAVAQDERPAPAVRRQRRAQPIYVSVSWDQKTKKNLHPIPTP